MSNPEILPLSPCSYEYRDYFEAEFGVIEAYDHGQYSYPDAYRYCFKVAMSMAFGLWGE